MLFFWTVAVESPMSLNCSAIAVRAVTILTRPKSAGIRILARMAIEPMRITASITWKPMVTMPPRSDFALRFDALGSTSTVWTPRGFIVPTTRLGAVRRVRERRHHRHTLPGPRTHSEAAGRGHRFARGTRGGPAVAPSRGLRAPAD